MYQSNFMLSHEQEIKRLLSETRLEVESLRKNSQDFKESVHEFKKAMSSGIALGTLGILFIKFFAFIRINSLLFFEILKANIQVVIIGASVSMTAIGTLILTYQILTPLPEKYIVKESIIKKSITDITIPKKVNDKYINNYCKIKLIDNTVIKGIVLGIEPQGFKIKLDNGDIIHQDDSFIFSIKIER